MSLKCRPHMEPSGVPCIRPPMPLVPERPRLPVMSVNGVKPDANGNVETTPPDLTELKGKVASLDEAVSEETRRAVGVEGELSESISAEATRAQTVEQGLRDDVSSAQSAIEDRYTKRETDEKIAAATPSDYDAVKGRVAAVEAKVPAQASAQNQLADKAFVNSSIATNTAFYISDGGRPFQSLADLENYEGALTNNDYAFVVGRDAAGNTTYTRYKWSDATETWAEEFVLNNSSFTASQWEAISSGITSGLVAKLGALPTAEALAAELTSVRTALNNHSGNSTIHITAAERAGWNAKQDALPLAGGSGSGSVKLVASGTEAGGDRAVALGTGAKATGTYSFAANGQTTASGARSAAFGLSTAASGDNSFAEGSESTASGSISHAEGRRSTADGTISHAEGAYTTASGDFSHAEGMRTKTTNPSEHAEGQYNVSHDGAISSIGIGSSDTDRKNAMAVMLDGRVYVNGLGGYVGISLTGTKSLQQVVTSLSESMLNPLAFDLTYGSGDNQIALFYDGTRIAAVDATAFIKDGMVSNVEIKNGNIVITFNTDAGKEPISIPLTDVFNPANYYSKTESDNKFATKTALGNHTGDATIHITAAERAKWDAKQNALPLEVGDPDKASSLKLSVSGSGANTANNTRAIALGYGLTVTGNNAFAANNQNTASGENANAFGYQTKATGRNSHTEGNVTVASNSASHAEGNNTKATGTGAHAEGSNTEASGNYSHTEGTQTKATAINAHAEGALTEASASHSHAEGRGTKTTNPHEHAEGQYNVSHAGAISSIGIGSSDTDRKNAVTVMLDGRVFVNGVGGYAGTETALTGKKSLQTVIDELSSSVQPIVETTRSELRTLRNGGGLKPGQQYRITDYVATTNGDMESRSAGHQFDIIVTADDEKTLNEHARAIIHDGELPDDIVSGGTRTKYFADCDLAAWDVWYCIDNDTDRFAWADAANGKGVIYRLVDEFQNDAPYDFKGIQFRRWAVTDVTSTTLDANSLNRLKSTFVKSQNGGLYYARQSSDISANDTTLVVDGSDSVWYYTFGGAEDLSRAGFANGVYANEIAEYVSANKRTLNNIIFLGSGCYSNTFGMDCDSNTFGADCYSNTFGMDCDSNTFGADCYSNTFGEYCYSNTFGEYCYSNTFGADCYSNTFGTYCHFNTFGTYCYSNTFGNACSYIKLGTASSVKSYCRYIRVGSGNTYLYINPTGTTSSSQYYKNVEIKEGVNNTSTYKTIDDPNVGQTFLTTYKPANSQEISV